MLKPEQDVAKQRRFFLNLLGSRKNVVTKKAGEIIVNIGQPGEVTYVLKTGKARIDLFGGQHIVALEPGDLLGMMGTLSGRPYEDTTVAVTDCELIPIDLAAAEFLFREHPLFGFMVIQVLIERFYTVMALARKEFEC
jgi:CRP-like cAMP-binding protein